MSDVSMRDSFLSCFKVKKDVSSSRAKGIMLEDALALLKSEYKLQLKDSFSPPDSCGYSEQYYESEDGLMRVIFCSARAGVPSLIVGCSNKEKWIEIRTLLRENKFVR